MNSIFRAYDVRGVYPEEINEEIVVQIGTCLRKHFFKKGAIVVGHDSRKSSPRLYQSLIKAMDKRPLRLIKAGLITSPMLYFLVAALGAEGGVIITASHEPKQYNGLKLVGRNDQPISGLEIKKKCMHLFT